MVYQRLVHVENGLADQVLLRLRERVRANGLERGRRLVVVPGAPVKGSLGVVQRALEPALVHRNAEEVEDLAQGGRELVLDVLVVEDAEVVPLSLAQPVQVEVLPVRDLLGDKTVPAWEKKEKGKKI